MVNIDQRSFNDDLGRYISSRRSDEKKMPDLFKFSFNKPKRNPEEKVPVMEDHEVVVEPKEPSWFQQVFGRKKLTDKEIEEAEELTPEEMKELEKVEEDIEEIEREEEVLQEERENLLKRFLKKLRVFESRHKPGEEEMVEECGDAISIAMDEDVRETLKILHRWLERLPPHEIKQFKLSEDYIRYKDLLKRYNLIK
ncbi:MAG: hypothetical protein ABIE94_03595 [archaeon]